MKHHWLLVSLPECEIKVHFRTEVQALWALTSSRGVFLLPLSRVLLTPFPPFPLTVFSTQLASSNTANSFTQQLNCLFAKNPFMEAVEKQDTHTPFYFFQFLLFNIQCVPTKCFKAILHLYICFKSGHVYHVSRQCLYTFFLHLLSVHLQ